MRVLLLSGGGFRGAFQLPIIEHYSRTHFDKILGVSVGAINGAMAAQEDLHALRKIWENIDDKKPIDGIKNFLKVSVLRGKGLYSLAPLRKQMEQHLALDRLQTQFGCGVVVRETRKYLTLSTEDMTCDTEYQDAVMASSAISGLMEPVRMKVKAATRTLCDGGHLHVLPLPPKNVTEVVAVFNMPLTEPPVSSREVDGLFEAVTWAIEIQMAQTRLNDMNHLQRLANNGVKVTVFAPQDAHGSMLKADRNTLKSRMYEGEKALTRGGIKL